MKELLCKLPSCRNLFLNACKLAMTIVLSAFCYVIAIAQTSKNTVLSASPPIGSYDLRPVAVGEKVPDVLIDNVTNFPSSEFRFSALRGKIVVLAFWQTTCGSCISDFPKMNKLQAKFKNDIQVVLVTNESKELVVNKTTNWKPLIGTVPNLPLVVEDTILNTLFPHSYAGHYVWIDQEGVVRLKGIGANNTEKKLASLLRGEEIQFLTDSVQYGNDSDFFQSSIYKSFSSTFSPFSNLAHAYGEEYRNEIDFVRGIVRATFLNQEPLRMYMYAFAKDLYKVKNEDLGIISYYDPYHARVIFGKGISKSSLSHEYANEYDDEWIRKDTYCYEQILPLDKSHVSFKYMQEDLNRFFCSRLGIKGKVDERKVKCYVLKTFDKKLSSRIFNPRVQKSEESKDYSFQRIISSMSWGLFNDQLLVNESGIKPETLVSIKKGEDSFKSISEFNEEIKKYGLIIVEAEREFPMLILYSASE
jgi:thiol-disulfide isomerase/thioredoxin